MQAATAFGKRKPAATAPETAPASQPVPELDSETPLAPPMSVRKRRVPYLTLALIAILSLIFWAELRIGPGGDQSLAPDVGTLTALGGLDGVLVFESGEWWRVFTAPLLHGSLSHLLGNAVALFFAGLILEGLIGPFWFAALFVISGLGGAAGTLALNPPDILSVGASGAIMGLLAAAFTCSFLFESEQLRRRMRKVSLRFLVPSLLPALLPLGAGSGPQVDYGAHIGGAIAGAAMGFLLSETWPELSPRPALERFAAAIALTGAFAAALAFALAGGHYSDYATQQSVFIPESELPRSENEGMLHSADLVEKYPHDPRARLFRAIYFLGQRNAADAERQLRLGLAERRALEHDLPSQVERSLQLALAAVLVIEQRKTEARTIAEPVCRSTIPPGYAKLYAMLKDQGICT